MDRKRQGNQTGRSKECIAYERFHDWTSEVGGDDFSVCTYWLLVGRGGGVVQYV
jgi:hypothetical protein